MRVIKFESLRWPRYWGSRSSPANVSQVQRQRSVFICHFQSTSVACYTTLWAWITQARVSVHCAPLSGRAPREFLCRTAWELCNWKFYIWTKNVMEHDVKLHFVWIMFIHSFIHSSKNWFIWSSLMSKWLQGHLTTSNEKTEFAAQDENSLSCAVV